MQLSNKGDPNNGYRYFDGSWFLCIYRCNLDVRSERRASLSLSSFSYFKVLLNYAIFKSSNLQIFKSSNLQIFKSSNLQIFKSSPSNYKNIWKLKFKKYLSYSLLKPCRPFTFLTQKNSKPENPYTCGIFYCLDCFSQLLETGK